MTHIQKAVEAIGDRGRYQKILLGYFLLIYIELGLMLIGSTFIFMNPSFNCPGMDNPSEDQACPILSQCPITNDYTATAYAHLYCGKQTDRSFIQSALYIGAILGLLLLTPYADEKGKKKIFCLSQGLALLGLTLNLVGIYTSITAIIIIGQILIGCGCYCILILGYVILGQLCQDKFKQVGIILLNAAWALSQLLIAAFYFWFNQWYNYIILILMIPFAGLFIFGLFYLVESPYYFVEKEKNIEKGINSLKRIATINNTDPSAFSDMQMELRQALQKIEEEDHKNQDQPKVSRFAIFKDTRHLKILLLVAVVEIGANAYYYGVQFSLGKLGTNFGYNIMLIGIIEFFAFFSTNFFITKFPRRKGTIGVNIICIVLGVLFFFDFPEIVQTILLGGSRWFNAYAMALVPFLQSEPFPHYYRSSVWGYIEGISQIGNFITPYIVTACENANIKTLVVLSGILLVAGIIPMIWIKQTLNKSEDVLEKEDEQEDQLLQSGISLQTEEVQQPSKPLLADP